MISNTALLHAIADKLIPGLGKSLRILLVSQIEDASAVVDSEGETVLQHVVKGDKERVKAMREFEGTPPPISLLAFELEVLNVGQLSPMPSTRQDLRRLSASSIRFAWRDVEWN